MTDDEIIKALECCNKPLGENSCTECAFYHSGRCSHNMLKAALDLINRQKAEIEQWKDEANRWQSLCCIMDDDIQNAKSEAIKKFAGKVDELLERYSHIHENAEIAMQDAIECDNETIEMQSVWDVHTLIRYEMGSEPEEMNRLQDNIETIAKERLLKEIEKDFRLLVKEMTEVETSQRKEDEGK